MTGSDVAYVAVAPRGVPGEDLVERVAAIINKDLFGTRALLTGKIPRVVAYYPDLQAAEPIAQRLRSLGLVTLVCLHSELRKPALNRFRAHTLRLSEPEAVFWDRAHQVKVVDPKSLSLILRGTARIQTEKEATRTRTSLNMTATIMTGGIPVVRKVQETTKTSSIQTEDFVRIYDWTSVEPIVEIFQYDFDYSSLEEKKRLSSLENMNVISTELRKKYPLAIFDNRLTEHFGVDVPFPTPGEEIEINCRLICLYHRAMSAVGR
jgi:hypothetical protein